VPRALLAHLVLVGKAENGSRIHERLYGLLRLIVAFAVVLGRSGGNVRGLYNGMHYLLLAGLEWIDLTCSQLNTDRLFGLKRKWAGRDLLGSFSETQIERYGRHYCSRAFMSTSQY
jgi:hypothetical protein